MHSRVAVVTGSNKGIGLAIVKELCVKFDGVVYLTSRNESLGLSAVEELKKLGLKPSYHQLDIDDESSVLKLRDYLAFTYGGLDVLVNNAAIGLWPDSGYTFHERAVLTLRTNFFHTHNACNILFPLLKPHARVVNVSSCAGHLLKITNQDLRDKLAAPELTYQQLSQLMQDYIDACERGDHAELGWPDSPISAYQVSKVGFCALTRIQQRQFDSDPRRDLSVNSVHPGYVDTDMSKHGGELTIEQGAVAPSWLALLPPNMGLKGAYIWHDKQIVDWENGPTPSAY